MTVKTSVTDIFRGTFPQLFAAVSGTLFAISDGMTVGWTAPMIPYLISEESHIKTTRHEAEWLETALLVGAFCGLPTTMFFTERIGRKKSLLLASFIVLFAWLAIALGNNMIYIFVARFFCGIAGNMAFVAAPMYIAEIADQKIRGFLSSIIYLMMLAGCLIVYCIGPFTPFYTAPILGICIALTELLVFSFVPESPYYLLYKNKPEQARKSLEHFRSTVAVDKEMKEISDAIDRQKTEKGRIQDLFIIDSNRKALLIMTVLNAGQNFCGIGVIMMNLHLILSEAGSIYLDEATTGILFAVIMLVSATGASLQLDKYGRKLLLITSAILTGTCLLIIALYFNLKYDGYNVISVSWIPIVSVMLYAVTFKIGLGIVPIVVTAEVFPAKMKAIGMTIADAMYVVWGIIALQVYQWLYMYGLHVSFYLFAVCSYLLAGFTQWYIPETKGKSLEEIQQILKGRKFSEVISAPTA
ncbi:facilitated trehalose transporter Tret1 [Anoplophora glabripennis]|uniref:facilitated trehalose transporter Tret1 n=1 Tax=Anoplophora glabripennis TaxID=217634 RepID=UPI00087382F0|nr:facilitated trehalose transporter Tret1 [Anoplophora glabripennis]